MGTRQINQLRSLEGRRVNVALRDGSRLDGCQLVSVGRVRVGARHETSMWLFTNGHDSFVRTRDVVDLWEDG
jgi:hypothetical protein